MMFLPIGSRYKAAVAAKQERDSQRRQAPPGVIREQPAQPKPLETARNRFAAANPMLAQRAALNQENRLVRGFGQVNKNIQEMNARRMADRDSVRLQMLTGGDMTEAEVDARLDGDSRYRQVPLRTQRELESRTPTLTALGLDIGDRRAQTDTVQAGVDKTRAETAGILETNKTIAPLAAAEARAKTMRPQPDPRVTVQGMKGEQEQAAREFEAAQNALDREADLEIARLGLDPNSGFTIEVPGTGSLSEPLQTKVIRYPDGTMAYFDVHTKQMVPIDPSQAASLQVNSGNPVQNAVGSVLTEEGR
jgi:hypothetical protein